MTNNRSFRREDNKLIFTRLLNAPRQLVWEAWTTPEHIKEWWGPNDFHITNKSMKVEVGQYWTFEMQGMGHKFDERIQYTEVEEPSQLSYRHFDEPEEYGFTVTVTFEEVGNQTLLTMTSVFKSAAILDELNSKVHAIEGGNQTLDSLSEFVERLASNSNDA